MDGGLEVIGERREKERGFFQRGRREQHMTGGVRM